MEKTLKGKELAAKLRKSVIVQQRAITTIAKETTQYSSTGKKLGKLNTLRKDAMLDDFTSRALGHITTDNFMGSKSEADSDLQDEMLNESLQLGEGSPEKMIKSGSRGLIGKPVTSRKSHYYGTDSPSLKGKGNARFTKA